ncbi:unnamed protein product [Echinostoma caproni]|uniref:protein-tyrosine-phosphatase n=1 Tax=Echinostoma caproni TaxID=27848 RepID=A0A183AJQ6_9TREM|nr:unnamed protein product [Echinostoma caproni]
MADTDSCPAAIQRDLQTPAVSASRRYSLPPVGELCAPEISPPAIASVFTKFSLSPINTSDESMSEREALDQSSFHPLHKKLRTESPGACTYAIRPQNQELDATVPLDDTCPLAEESANVHDEGKPEKELGSRPKPLFDMFRHQSTPMVPTRSKPFMCPAVASPLPVAPSTQPECKPSLSRCASVPVETFSESLGRCLNALDSHYLRFEDRRPRALPVVDRTASGLHCVSTETVAGLVSGSVTDRNVRHVIVDCRFPYEYEGGHIQGAINIFTHSDLVQEIFNRVPAQRPPGVSGPPRLLGEGLSRRLAMTLKEPLSAPCETVSDDDSLLDSDAMGQTTADTSDLELAAEHSSHSALVDSPSSRSEPDMSVLSQGSGPSSSNSQEPAFVVIFHCEFSSQRAPDLCVMKKKLYYSLLFEKDELLKRLISSEHDILEDLCCPKNYVKMFHRDYRSQLRLYKRLTKRVSSACLACIRPQQHLLNSSDDKIKETAGSDAMNSFGQICVPPSHPAMIAANNLGSASSAPEPVETSVTTKARLAMIDSMMRQASLQQYNDPWVGIDDDKENASPEVVVRVGRRVIAATLSSADSSAAQLLHKFSQPADAIERAVIPLKRRNTVCELGGPTNRAVQPRALKRGPPALPNPFALESDEPNTPAPRGLRRVQTLQFTPLQNGSSLKRSGWFHSQTPSAAPVAMVSSVQPGLSTTPTHF